MAHTEDWTLTYEADPVSTDSPADGDEEFRDLKLNIRERMEGEHYWKDSQTNDGKHLLGSARIWVTNAEPTTQPNGSAANATVDTGRVWYNDTSGGVLYYTGANYQYQSYFDTNLIITGTVTCADITATGDLTLSTNLSVGGDAIVDGTLTVAGNTDIDGDLEVAGTGTFLGVVSLESNLQVAGTATVTGNTTISGDLEVAGTTTLASLTVSSNLNLQATTTFASAVTVDSNLTVTGNMSIANIAKAFTGGHRLLPGRQTPTNEDQLFNILDPYIPNAEDTLVISGGINHHTNGVFIPGWVRRKSSTEMEIYGMRVSDGLRTDFTITDGNTDSVSAYIAW